MEQGIREFLKRILNAMSMTLLWMLVNATAGIRFKLGFPENGVKFYHIIFYVWLVGSFAWLVWYLVKVWKKPVEIDE